jgi:formylglycine-generating enzyme required for sulfatase activity
LNELQSSAWYRACSKDGAQQYPYGDGKTYDPSACNGSARDSGTTMTVGSIATCEGAVPGLRDMVGNVSEWTNICQTSVVGVSCRYGGGAFRATAAEAGCSEQDGVAPVTDGGAFDFVGFRCCYP